MTVCYWVFASLQNDDAAMWLEVSSVALCLITAYFSKFVWAFLSSLSLHNFFKGPKVFSSFIVQSIECSSVQLLVWHPLRNSLGQGSPCATGCLSVKDFFFLTWLSVRVAYWSIEKKEERWDEKDEKDERKKSVSKKICNKC